jgi:hypothetical protein
MNEEITASPSRKLDELVEIASRLAGSRDLGAVHLTIPARPTSDELQHYHAIADANERSLSVTAIGLTLRPKMFDPGGLEREQVTPTSGEIPVSGLAANSES